MTSKESQVKVLSASGVIISTVALISSTGVGRRPLSTCMYLISRREASPKYISIQFNVCGAPGLSLQHTV
jgi:hypothetical protein